ncbi:NXPE family member 3-like [Plectropomus leopardus]|uniref:NXPE family member 3-like n=1 Tax=Plectropomus leopardus TaxID=160734 RepID=UPI001C4DB982|nr:NXPE family member 3-like [Plectropomus leopardus]
MNIRACARRDYSVIFLILALAVLIFVLWYIEVLEWSDMGKVHGWIGTKYWPLRFGSNQPKTTNHPKFQQVNSTTIVPSVSTNPDMHQRFCIVQPLSAEDALEERLLLDSIAWPNIPRLPVNFALNQTSDPAHSTFTILPRRGGGQWHVGDQLEVMITVSDFQGRPKQFGGDFLLARLHNMELGAGVAGQVVDHLNGSYSAVFPLLWEGEAYVQVTLVHPSEAIPVLSRLNSKYPDRVYFLSIFRSGSLSETTICNFCLRQTKQPMCDYTDLRTGQPWFCYKPKNLSCDARIIHYSKGHRSLITSNERRLFIGRVNLKVNIRASGPANVTVLPKEEGQPKLKSSSVTSGPSGYYYQGAWQALSGAQIQQFNTSAITQCLKGKVVHVQGDSTMRQLFDFIVAAVPDLQEFVLPRMSKFESSKAFDFANNILVMYHFHGPPLISHALMPPTELHYIANEIDGLIGGTNTVVIFGIWAHIAPFTIEIYIRRLQGIRRAVVQLLERAPETVVIIRAGNPREMSNYFSQIFSDWYSLQRYKVLRAMFKGLNVHLIDSWEMVLAHHLPHNVHPPRPIIENMANVILSYTCPPKGS